ncbi:unnamed protein product [Schistosoma mattheei]|uniref:Uncharacterized protein n=1 Tax=Schistosoma mattheei TaxID=31246 RepID=A0A3P8CNU1_9TREM|nr:unnamed protein product [Schistosoma mattheei]
MNKFIMIKIWIRNMFMDYSWFDPGVICVDCIIQISRIYIPWYWMRK